MSESKHTPGPWVIEGSLVATPGDNGVSVCCIDPVDNPDGRWVHGEETWANANLICAAPDLLDAASHVLSILDHESRSVTALDADRLRAAIAKALGGQT